jgi:hypothetical protein
MGSGSAGARTLAASLIRRGPRSVVLTPTYMGFGNLLYLALWCDADPVSRRFVRTAKLEPWLSAFPSLRDLTTPQVDIRLTDIRRSAVSQSYGRFGEDFTRTHLEDFIRRRLIHAFAPSHDDAVVLNIRRGDYYDDRHVRGYFSFDLDAYLRTAVPALLRQRGASEIHIVSDGMEWCRARSGWIERDLGIPVTFASTTGGPLADLVTVATARRILMTNSTFSYWAGYIHDVLYPNSEADVWAPRFFSRWQTDYSAWQLNPEWSVVEDIPGGWDS